jgi:hypothetical protein
LFLAKKKSRSCLVTCYITRPRLPLSRGEGKEKKEKVRKGLVVAAAGEGAGDQTALELSHASSWSSQGRGQLVPPSRVHVAALRGLVHQRRTSSAAAGLASINIPEPTASLLLRRRRRGAWAWRPSFSQCLAHDVPRIAGGLTTKRKVAVKAEHSAPAGRRDASEKQRD